MVWREEEIHSRFSEKIELMFPTRFDKIDFVKHGKFCGISIGVTIIDHRSSSIESRIDFTSGTRIEIASKMPDDSASKTEMSKVVLIRMNDVRLAERK
jgi:hypothetical protein